MKSLFVPSIVCFGLLASVAVLAQHQHLEAGASSAVHGGHLRFVNAEHFATTGGFVQPLVWADEGPYAGYFHGNITMTVRAATLQRGGPAAFHPALGTQVSVELLAVEGPPGGEFAFWEQGSEVPTVALKSGDAGTQRWLLSENDGEAGSDPYGHFHGRRFTATDPGIYTVTFRLHDESTHGHEGGPLHESSETLDVRFIAGDGIPISVVKGGNYVLGISSSNGELGLSVFEDDGHTDHVHDPLDLAKTVFEISRRWRGQTEAHDFIFNAPGRRLWYLPSRQSMTHEDTSPDSHGETHGGETHGGETHGGETHGGETHGGETHVHDAKNGFEWDGDLAPVIEMELEEDPAGGFNVYLNTVGFTFSPENASSHHVPGEGHAHIYVDGVKLGRLYTHRYFLYALPEGKHTVRVTLNSNTHEDYTLDGHRIEAVSEVVVAASDPEPDQGEGHGDGHSHGHDHGAVLKEWDGGEVPNLGLEVLPDPASGWNVFFEYDGFDLNPRNASRAHVPGEGHTHIYVNGDKITRLYGHAYHLASLPEGEVTVAVRLSANDHQEYAVDGMLLGVTTRVQNGATGAPNEAHEPLTFSLNTEGLVGGEFVDDSVEFSVTAVSTPGEMALLSAREHGGTLSETILARLEPGGESSFSISVGEILPLSWAFRSAGDYEFLLSVTGTLADGMVELRRSSPLSLRVMPSDLLHYSVVGNQLRLTWDDGRPLQAATRVDGHFTVLPDAHGVFESDVAGESRFFRLAPMSHQHHSPE